LPLNIADNKMQIEHKNIVSGKWIITIDFTSNSKEYLVKRAVNF
jgi:hypothetical protein